MATLSLTMLGSPLRKDNKGYSSTKATVYEMQSVSDGMFRLNKINMNSLFLKDVICKSVTTQLTCRWKPKAWRSGAASDSSHLLLYYHGQHCHLYNYSKFTWLNMQGYLTTYQVNWKYTIQGLLYNTNWHQTVSVCWEYFVANLWPFVTGYKISFMLLKNTEI